MGRRVLVSVSSGVKAGVTADVRAVLRFLVSLGLQQTRARSCVHVQVQRGMSMSEKLKLW